MKILQSNSAGIEAAIRLLEMPSPAKSFGDILETAIPKKPNSVY
jgi:hypothetical protein